MFAVYSTFLQRTYDMLIHDVAIQKLHVVLAVDRVGLVGEDGETHHGVFDAAFLDTVPGITVFSPSSYAEVRTMLRCAVLGQPIGALDMVEVGRGASREFPVKAADLPGLQGAALGARLKELQRRWLQSGLRATKDQLLG